ncbi:MAG: sterol desaturase family protein [Acidobacteria bacterium]|nr:sterol desaturase family protein [Acidobacteriota bacterium]
MPPLPSAPKLIVGFAILAIVFMILERFAAATPRKPLFRRERAVDFAWWFFTPWVTKTASSLAAILGIIVATLFVRMIGGTEPSPRWIEAQPRALQVAEMLLLADLLGYGAHRLFHGRTLWRFHAIHHSAEDLDWLIATRVHPVNDALMTLLQFVPLYLLGFRGTTLTALVPLLSFYALFLHANLRWDFGPLRYVLASPAFHRWHHTSEAAGLDRNFAGLFPWIDLLFGTFYLPRHRHAQRFGLDGDRVPRTLLGQLAYPFRRRTIEA